MRLLSPIGLVVVFIGASAAVAQTSTELPTVRPKPIFLQAPWEHMKGSGEVAKWDGGSAVQAFAGPGQAPFRVYLNRFGGTYCSGPDDATQNSSIVPNGCGTIAPFPYGDSSWQQVKSCLDNQFARFNIVMVEQEPPANVEYAEHVIGGRPQDVGLPNGVGGVAPIDNFQCGVLTHAINYTFAAVYGNDPQSICETAAQEIAHSFSLDHAYLCTDPMTYLNGCGEKTFQDTDAQCGEYQPRQCNCGRNRQNSVQLMYELLGPAEGEVEPPVDDPTAPSVSISTPPDGSVLPLDQPVVVTATAADNVGIAALELNWYISETSFGCPTNEGGGRITCTRNGNTATWNIIPSQGGSRTFSVTARDTAGNETTTADRTIQLDENGVPPPAGDGESPTVALLSPANGSTLQGNSTMQVVATANDNSGQLSSLELLWTYTGDAFSCPFDGNGVSCTQSGNTFTWSLSVGLGQRGFQVRAVDLSGNTSTTEERVITLSADGGGNDGGGGTPVDPPTDDIVGEPNNSAGEAFGLGCGTAIDLLARVNDDDYFAIETAAGVPVDVSIAATAAAVRVQLLAPDGVTELSSSADIVADGGTLRATATTGTGFSGIIARVTTLAPTVPYRLVVVCGGGGDQVDPTQDDDNEEDDTIETATLERCPASGEGRVAADADHYRLQVRDGDTVQATLDGSGAQATILDVNGNVLGGPGNTAQVQGVRGGDVIVRITPAAGAVAYGYSFSCSEGGQPLNGGLGVTGCGCAQNDALSLVMGISGLALLRRRRGAKHTR
jgi:hypothetical protein